MQDEIIQMLDALHPTNPVADFFRRLTADRHASTFLFLALALLMWGVEWLWEKWAGARNIQWARF